MSESDESRSPATAESIRTLISYIEETDLEELDLRWSGGGVRIVQDALPYRLFAGPVSTDQTRANTGTPVVAPLTGVYYSRPSPDQPAFASAGASVAAGDVIGLIETMKLFNEIIAEVSGTVESIAVADGDLVEKGQTLMNIVVQEG